MQDTNLQRQQRTSRRLLSLCLTLSGTFAVIGCARMWWAWPNAPMLTNLDMIGDIDALLSHRFSDVRWLILQRHHALTGYTWYQYLSAIFFNLDTRWEITAYYVLAFALAVGVGSWALIRVGGSQRIESSIILLVIPLVILNLAGAGTRGMELGTFAGVTIITALVLLSQSRTATRTYTSFSLITIFLITQLFLGGYIFGWVLALGLGCLVEYRTKNSIHLVFRSRIGVLFIGACMSATVFYLMYLLGPHRDISSGAEFSGIAKDALFPIKYLWSSFGSALIPITTLDRFPIGSHLWIIWLGSFFLGACIVFAAYLVVKSRQSGLFVLVCYNFCLAVTLLPVRDASAYQMLNSWYSFHGKVSLAIAATVIVLNIPKNRSLRMFSGVILVGVFLLAVASYSAQFKRGNDERRYFGKIAISSLAPELLSVDTSGQTQLRLGLEQSATAIRTMRRLGLGVHTDPAKLRHLMNEVQRGIWIGGDFFDDGWLGKFAVMVIDRDRCPVARIDFSIDGLMTSNVVEVKRYPNFHIGRASVAPASQLFVEVIDRYGIYFLVASDTVKPSDVSGSRDFRELATHLDIACKNNPNG